MNQRKGRAASTTVTSSSQRVLFQTFGCRLNQYDSDCLKGVFRAAGYAVVGDSDLAGLFVVNTCSVTAEAERQARQYVRRIAREHPDARIVVTGCYADRAADEVRSLPSVSVVAGNADKTRLLELLPAGETGTVVSSFRGESYLSLEHLRTTSLERTRPYLRVQDGCDNRCSYCIVPYTRGPSRSAQPGWVLEEAGKLIGLGAREIVLTGARLGAYGRDLNPQLTLTDIVAHLLEIDADLRLRLSSVEPDELSSSLIALMEKTPKLCAHLHLPLQSGSDTVLRRMGRNYSASFYKDIVRDLRRRLPHAAIGADVLVGFPGESEAEFNDTRRLLEDIPVSYCHVFPFSRRPGTRAYELTDTVPRVEKLRRGKLVRSVSREKWRAFRRSLVGTTEKALLERTRYDGTGTGITGNYVRVLMPNVHWNKSGFTRIVITGVCETTNEAMAVPNTETTGRRCRCQTG